MKDSLVDRWAFTFGHGSKRRYNFVVIAGRYHEARKKMVSVYGAKWASQYSWEDFKDQVEDYNLTELELGK